MSRKLLIFLLLIIGDFLSTNDFVDERLIFQQMRLIGTCMLAEKLSMHPTALSCLLFTFRGSNEYALVPIMETEIGRKFWRTIFAAANPAYMTFYVRRNTIKEADADFKKRVFHMWNTKGCSDSMTFISLYNGLPSGEISIGPLRMYEKYPEIGYITLETFAHKGVASASLKLMINLIKTLVGKGAYAITRLSATCHPQNTASSRVLEKVGFRRVRSYAMTSYGIRDLYEMPIIPVTREF
ncbi:MAG: GNAT family N-acetyltransferase [Holosporaceae bacterium]|jgi:RimJ/RimL family protein N-acetyltransferase|nr:GNAT family N-acetyltransferase [Holosporaceae bacterium]